MENLLATVQQVRATFGPTMTDDECARLCNEVAWRHRTTGWGLSRKTSGTRGRLPNGVEVAHDILHHQPTNTLVDILTAAGAASAPVWQHVGPPMSPDRAWLAPVDPATWAPAPAGPSEAELLLAELRALAAEVVALKQAMQASVRVEAAIDRGLPLRLKSIVGTLVGTVGGHR